MGDSNWWGLGKTIIKETLSGRLPHRKVERNGEEKAAQSTGLPHPIRQKPVIYLQQGTGCQCNNGMGNKFGNHY
jgi:hypothetical protein